MAQRVPTLAYRNLYRPTGAHHRCRRLLPLRLAGEVEPASLPPLGGRVARGQVGQPKCDGSMATAPEGSHLPDNGVLALAWYRLQDDAFWASSERFGQLLSFSSQLVCDWHLSTRPSGDHRGGPSCTSAVGRIPGRTGASAKHGGGSDD